MNIGYLIAGCIFLFNPTVNLIDVLPDVIGYLLILKGLDTGHGFDVVPAFRLFLWRFGADL